MLLGTCAETFELASGDMALAGPILSPRLRPPDALYDDTSLRCRECPRRRSGDAFRELRPLSRAEGDLSRC
jgi:hypothetical protein